MASKKAPADNKFHQGNGSDGRHYWLTPPDVYQQLHLEFQFTHDPCPYPLPEGVDGLVDDWGASNNENKLVKVVYANGVISETRPAPEPSPGDDNTVTISVDAKAKTLTPETRRRISKFVQGVQRNAGFR